MMLDQRSRLLHLFHLQNVECGFNAPFILLNRLLSTRNGRSKPFGVEQEVIITNINLLFHFGGHNNDLLVLKQWKGVFNRVMPLLLCFFKNRSPRATRSVIIFKEASEHRLIILCRKLYPSILPVPSQKKSTK